MTTISPSKAALSHLPTPITDFFSRGADPLPRRIYVVGVAVVTGLGLIYGIRHYFHHRGLSDVAARRVDAADPGSDPVSDVANRANQLAVDSIEHFSEAA